MKTISKGILILAVIAALMTPSFDTEAKTVYKYATKTVQLKQRTNDRSKTMKTVKVHTKLKITHEWKVWCRVEWNGKNYYTHKAYLHSQPCANKYTPKYFKRRGVIRWGGKKWTWYTQRQLPGKGLKIPGRHLDKKLGYVLDKDGYIVLASSIGYKKQRKILPTPFGRYGKVYDTNGTWNYGWRDVYTNW